MEHAKVTFEYGAGSSRYRLEAEDKRTAYCAMCIHYSQYAHLIALYEPKEIVKNDSWLNPFGNLSKRLDEIFGGEGEFDKYLESHTGQIREAYSTITQIV